MRAIGCAHRIAQKTNIIRLGAKRNGKCRPLMVCFSNENAVNKVLNMSPNLCRSALYGHIYVKRDLPRNQRPSANRRNANVYAEAGRGGGTSDARDQHSSDAGDDENDLSDIDSESDFSDTDLDRSSDDDYDTVVETDAMLTWDELSRNEEVEETSRNEDEGRVSERAQLPRYTHQ